MAIIHSATAGALTDDIVGVVIECARHWQDIAVSQAAGIHAYDSAAAARFAINDLLADLTDHLGVAVTVTLATHGITADGTRPE